ncbi:COG1361 S-layer family protein [Methanolobus sp. ZRKC3]|uniref:COG1361 S-layer family protein n=1 Tax=Methanolobus sp. ZRKC3 TaxID=3125786 RepID=UPI00324DF638
MKKIIMLMAVIALSISSASAAMYYDASGIEVDLMSMSPNPARPGESVELTLSVQNTGNSDLEDIVIQIEPEYPFSAISGESLSKSISYLSARQEDDDSSTVKFKLKVDTDVSDGFYEIDVKTSISSTVDGKNTGSTTTDTLDVEVRGKEYAQIVTISKSSIGLATEESIDFVVTNTGNSPLQNMEISWSDASGVILPVYSGNTKYVRSLDVGESATVSYTVMADVNAVPGLYQLDITLEFEDYDSNVEVIESKAGLFVGGETDFDVSFSESSSGEVSLTVANVGNNEAYSVKVSIPEQDSYGVSGSSSSIVGNLDKGDYTITSFAIVSSNNAMAEDSETANEDAQKMRTASRRNELEVVIEYTDSTGQRLSVEKNVPIDLMGSEDAAAAGVGGRSKGSTSSSSSTWIYAVLIVAAVGGFLYYRKTKGEKGKEQ